MRYNLFVIEDDRDTIELLKEIFSEQEYCLRCFSSSIKALQVLKEEGLPDLVLLDLMMPQMDGITFLEQVRKMSASLPVIMITAHGLYHKTFQFRGVASGSDQRVGTEPSPPKS